MVSFNFTFDDAVSYDQRVAFELAARIWGTYLTDDVVVNLHIASTDGLDGNAVGGAVPFFYDQLYGIYQGYAEADITASSDSTQSVDQQAFDSLQQGNTTALLLDGSVIESNTTLAITSAQAKALGMSGGLLLENGNTWERNLVDANALDGYILINQSYTWNYDFLREKKARGKTLDFLSMAMHEIGHVLGFVSGIDGTMTLESMHSGEQTLDNFTVLDLYRYSSDSDSVTNPDGSVSDVSVGGDAYFSIDSGDTNLANFSTGQQKGRGGDGYQASHWKRLRKAMGLMDPTLAYKERLRLTLLDLQAMDVLGWDINYDALDDGLDMQLLLAQAEMAAQTSGEMSSGNQAHSDLYEMSYGALFQQFQAAMSELGYDAIFDELEASFEAWRNDDSLLNMSYGALYQEFKDRIFEMGYGELYQSLETDMFEMGYGELYLMFEMGYGPLFQQLDAYVASGAHEEASDAVNQTVDDAYVGGNIERIYKGGADDDILSGTEKQDRIDGGDGDDFLDGREGHDVLWGDAGKDILYGQEGNDFLRGGEGNDLLEGESGNDELYGDEGHDVLIGGDGNDLLEGGSGRDELKGDRGDDVISGGSGDDLIQASAGNDIAVGGDGNDNVAGGRGSDILFGDRSGVLSEESLHALKAQFAAQIKSGSTSQPIPATTNTGSGQNPIRIEAEDMNISGQYEKRDRSSDSGLTVRALSDITGESVFNGPSGSYMVLTRYLDDADGSAQLSISVNDNLLKEWTLDRDDEFYHTRTVAQSVTLNSGDIISFSATPSTPNSDGRFDNAYIDYIELIPLNNLLTTSLDAPVQDSSTTGTSTNTNSAISANLTMRVEAEDMTLAGDYRVGGSGQFIEATRKGTGLALTSFSGDTGFYDVVVGYYDESDGTSRLTAELNNKELDSWRLDQDLGNAYVGSDNLVNRTVARGVLLNQDDVLKLVGFQSGGEFARIDYVDFVKVAAPITKEAGVVEQSPTEEGLLAHWKFDELAGNRVIDSVGSAHGVLYNTEATDWTRGAAENGIRFDGTNEKFHVAQTSQFDTGSNSDFSAAFWTKIEAGPTGDWRNLVYKGQNAYYMDGEYRQNRDFGIYLHPDSNRLHYRLSTTHDWNEGGSSQSALQENQWYHIAYVKEGSELSLYINGQQDSSFWLQGQNIDSGGDLWAGGDTASVLDDLRVYNRALDAEDLSDLTNQWQPGGFDDVVQGGNGNDLIFGGAGRDVIYGDHENGADGIGLHGAQFFKGSAYLLSETGKWLEAQTEARRFGGNLVTLNTQEEETLLQDRYGRSTAFWIGINDAEVEGQWEWASGEAVTYTNWTPGQPDGGNGNGEQDYGQLNFRDGQWDDNYGNRGGVIIDGAWQGQDTAGIIELVANYDDTLFGGSGNDAIYGGAGNDFVYGESLASSLSEGLVAHWHFDEGSGLNRSSTLWDSTTNTWKHSATVVSANGSSTWTEGVFAGAIDFGDNISQLRVADSDELDITRQITISTWINGDEFQNYDGLVSKGDVTSPYALQVLADGRLRFVANYWTGGEYGEWVSEGKLTTGNWHHAAVTYDGEAVRFYIDGQLDANVSYAEVIFDTNNQDLVIGADLPGGQEYLDGQLDDLRLYNRALSGTEIAKLAEKDASTFEYNGSTYLLTSKRMTWSEAQAEAESLGGNLVTVNEWQERNWLNRVFGWGERFWLGYNDAVEEGNWQWASGEQSTFDFWAEGDPNNENNQDYAVINDQGGRWADTYETGGYYWNGTEWIWEEGYRGIIEIKPPAEGQNDVIIAGIGNDLAVGGLGDDIINGTDAASAGYFERDRLWGGAGSDTFVLGDQYQAYYQGEQNEDYALVKDFDSSDIIQLHGSTDNYTVEQNGADANLYYNGDLVAIFEKTTYTAEHYSQARFV